MLVEYTTFLVNFDDGSASVVCDHSAHRVSGKCSLLSERHVSWIFLWQGIFVADCDVWVDESVGSTHVNKPIWIVSLCNFFKFETSRFSLGIGILNSFFYIAIEDTLSLRHRVLTVFKVMDTRITATAYLHL